MPYYHVYIIYKDEKRVRTPSLTYNLTDQSIRERIATPFAKNKSFIVGGKVYQPSRIDEIAIFISDNDFEKLVLPDGESPLGHDVNYIANCFFRKVVKGVDVCTDYFITSPPAEKEEERKTVTEQLPQKEKPSEVTVMESASFLGLDINWLLATSALQLQEVAITLVSKRKGIALDKTNVEKVLNKEIENALSFNDQYEAFSRQVKDAFNIEMPILTGHLRKMRAKVLHEGYNPKPEEAEPIVSFTIGLLQKLKRISETT